MARCVGTGSSAYPNAWQGKEKGLTAESSPGGKATRWRGGGSSSVPRGLRGPGPKNLLQGILLLRGCPQAGMGPRGG